MIPKINNLCNFKEITNQCKEYDTIILAYENEKENKLKNEIEKLKSFQKEKLKIAIIIGPEGGIDIEDLSKANEFISVEIEKYDSDLGEYMLEVSSPGAEKKLRNID